jgi:hypothetical protein
MDISEPRNQTTSNYWKVTWYLKFDNSSATQDFEINWKFIKNKIVDEKKASTFEFPPHRGFDISAEEREILTFDFKSSNLNRKYMLSFVSDSPTINSKSSYIKFDLKNGKPEFQVPNSYLNDLNNPLPFLIDSKSSRMKIKRTNKFSLQIDYSLDSQMGDCDFDASFCNYVSDLEQPINELNQNNLLITHKPKYASLNTNEYDVLNKAKDYYLSVLKSNEKNGGSIYSPLIGLQKTTTKETAADPLKFNQKIYTLSFSYMIHNSSDNKISLVLLTNRSDAKVSIIQKKVLAEYSQKSLEFDKHVSLIDFKNDCPTFTIGSMLNSFILTNKEKKDKTTLIPSAFSPATLTSSENNNGSSSSSSSRVWYRVTKRLFSCFDFRFGFNFNFTEHEQHAEEGAARTVSLNSASSIGIDDVELNYESHVGECDKEICGSNGKCFKFDDKPLCCCNPGFEGETCERQINPCDYLQSINGNRSICQNDGKCQNNQNEFDYTCECPNGFNGKNCEFEMNECEPVNPCKNNGKCIDHLGSFECICKTGFGGKTCELKAEFCKDKCSIGTYECLNDKQDALCVCLPDYTGPDCSIKIKIDHCESNPCSDEAKCESTLNGFQCICPDDRVGKFCEHKVDYCHGKFCLNFFP